MKTTGQHARGKDKYGHFVVFNVGTQHEFRSAMPSGEVAAACAAAPSLLEACKSALERIDGMNEAMGVVDELRRAITLAEEVENV